MRSLNDIRRKDVVRLREGLSPEQMIKVYKIARKTSRAISSVSVDALLAFVKKHANGKDLLVHKTFKTLKTNTECAIVSIVGAIYANVEFAVQTRYLTLVNRKPNHPVTKIFQ